MSKGDCTSGRINKIVNHGFLGFEGGKGVKVVVSFMNGYFLIFIKWAKYSMFPIIQY